MEQKIEQLKARLAAARQNAAPINEKLEARKGLLGEKIEELRKLWEADHKELIETAGTANIELADADRELRNALIEFFSQTGKKVYDGELSVRVTTKLEYDAQKAVDWAIENAPFMLNGVNKKLFETAADHHNFNFVKRIENVSAVVAKDLTVVIDKIEEVAA